MSGLGKLLAKVESILFKSPSMKVALLMKFSVAFCRASDTA